MTVHLTIDGQSIGVPAGTSVLDAAKWLGIRIPTMCHVPGIEPASSCFLCAVQIDGRRGFSPSCAMPVSEGMVVTTNSEDVRTARRMALELMLSDHAGECVAPCAARCPAGLDIPGFVYGISREDTRGATEVIARRLALPGALGRVCPRLCEQQCRRCELDQGLAIGELHRYVTDIDFERENPYLPPCSPPTGKSVGIIGAGPAGLAAAYFLLQRGHACTLYDAHDQPGGMLRYGIPAYRLPRKALDQEIDLIRKMGARFVMGTRWGVDFTLEQLRARHSAVFVAIGAQQSQLMRCEGEEMALGATDVLGEIARGNRPELGSAVVVIGGGNTAMDCARSAVRLAAESVRVLYRRSRQEMPCLMEEVEAAELEGVHLDLLVAPLRIERLKPSGLLAVTCQRMELGEADASGRRRPVPVAGSEFRIECTAVIAAIGQTVDRDLAGREGLRVTGWGVDAAGRTMETNLPGVFAGGDAVLGADLAVRAVAAGRKAAVSIDQSLHKLPVTGEPMFTDIALRPIDNAERAQMFRAIEQAARVRPKVLSMHRRQTTFEEVEHGLDAETATREAHRCLSCGCRKSDCCSVRSLATEYQADVYRFQGARRRFTQDDSHPEIIYEPGKCICCDACVRIAAAAEEPLGLSLVGRGFDVVVAPPFGQPLSEGLRKTAQRCAEACPSGALALRTARACDACHSHS